MIEPVGTVFAIGYTAGVIVAIIAGGVAVAINSKGKKPEYIEPETEYEEGSWECPVCSSTVGIYDLRDNYCAACGTKIDWRKDSEKKHL